MINKNVIVIGSGFAGLSVACFMAKAGYDVTILEKNATPGGRARKFEEQGFLFDMGPSWYWMPDVFERFFSQFGKKVSDYYELVRLSPSYQVIYSEQDKWDIPASVNELASFLDSIEAGAGKKLALFLQEAAVKYEVGIKDLVFKPGRSITEFLTYDFFKGLLKLDLFTSHSAHVKKYFSNPKIISLLEFPVLFLGAKPEQTPALYSLMNYADINLGTWYPKGGMHKIVEGMVALATSLGVKIKFNQAVKSFVHQEGKITKVITSADEHVCDIVIAGADYHHIDQEVIESPYRNYSASYWDKRTMAPSSLLFYLGIDKKLTGLQHHNLFFDEDFGQHAIEIYDQPQWPSKPLFYVSCPSVTDHLVAPEGKENVFILIPVAPGIEDTPAIREKYFDMVMQRLETLTNQSIKQHIIFKRSYAHQNFMEDYNSFKGNAYGLANTLMQTALLKPSLKSKKLNNLFFTGQLTVPGPGVPPSLISGEVVAKEVIKQFKLQ
ncbi:MAG: phytoene desaturase family protein [Bacteroidota bacterium]